MEELPCPTCEQHSPVELQQIPIAAAGQVAVGTLNFVGIEVIQCEECGPHATRKGVAMRRAAWSGYINAKWGWA